MRRRTRRTILAVALIGALAVGGAAFTASNTFSGPSVAGYGNESITGASVTNTHYVLSADGTKIDEVDLTFAEDHVGDTVKAGFGAASSSPSLTISCTPADNSGAAPYTAKCGDHTSTPLGVTNDDTNAGEFALSVSQ